MGSMWVMANLSTENYNKLLAKWSQLDLERDVTFDVGFAEYSKEYANERQYIIDTFNWTINDWGQAR